MNIDILKNKIIAHRGYHNNIIPENSIMSFKKAIDNNYPIELDIRLLKDNNIIVFHDNNLKRMTEIDKNINDLSYNDIKNIRLLNTKEKIPLLKDVLRLINGKVPIIIEIKNDTLNHTLEDLLLDMLKEYKGIFFIMSFNPFSIKYIKKKNSFIITGLLYSCNKKKKRYFFNNLSLLNLYSQPDFISFNIKCLPNKNLIKIRKNKCAFGWTIKSKYDLKYAKDYCDAYICENLDSLEK